MEEKIGSLEASHTLWNTLCDIKDVLVVKQNNLEIANSYVRVVDI